MYSTACNVLKCFIIIPNYETSTFIYVLIFEIPKSSEQYSTKSTTDFFSINQYIQTLSVHDRSLSKIEST